jgi:hypothetical protein
MDSNPWMTRLQINLIARYLCRYILQIPTSSGNIEGNRLVNVLHFFNQLKRICSHGECFGCNFSNLTLEKEVRTGLSPRFVIKCGMCNNNNLFHLDSQKNSSIDTDINASAVRGIISIGCGFYNLEEFLASVNVPCMAQGTFQKMLFSKFEIINKEQ